MEGSKSPINEVFRTVRKSYPLGYIYAFLLRYESVNGILTFSKNEMFGKNLVLQSWPKQNAGVFKREYFTNKLRYEAEFFDVTRGP